MFNNTKQIPIENKCNKQPYDELSKQLFDEVAELTDNKELLKQIVNTCPIGVLVAGIDRKVILFNKKGAELSDYDCDYVLNTDWSRYIHFKDRSRIVGEFNKTLRGEETSTTLKCDLVNGTPVVIESWSVIKESKSKLVVYFYKQQN